MAFEQYQDRELFDWLPPDCSKAFVICIGAGPWKLGRRTKVQGDALKELDDRDLFNIDTLNSYPFSWQKKAVRTMAQSLRDSSMTMNFFCDGIRKLAEIDGNIALRAFYGATGCPMGTKVISLFCRDALKIPSFPIDRHVRRVLEKHELPVKESELLELCNAAGLDPRVVATAFVRSGLDRGNPDWRSA